jgi:hypothetical protein
MLVTLVLLVCILFNDAISSSDYLVSDDTYYKLLKKVCE